MIHLASLILFSQLFIGCSILFPKIDVAQLRGFEKGMTKEDVIEKVKRKPSREFTIELDTGSIKLLEYKTKLGVKAGDGPSMEIGGGGVWVSTGVSPLAGNPMKLIGGGGGNVGPPDTVYFDKFYLSFHNDTLIYWGLKNRYKLSDDGIAKKIYPKLP